MNKFLYILLACLLYPYNLSYAQEYVPFPTETAVWSSCLTGSFGLSESLIQLIMQEDTIIQGKTYQKLYVHLYEEIQDTTYTALYGGIREQDQKIYLWNKESQKEWVWYDFNLSIGKSVQAIGGLYLELIFPSYIDEYNWQVVDQDSIAINGQYRKLWHMQGNAEEEIWIEGLGEYIPPFNALAIDLGAGGSTCFSADGQLHFFEDQPICSSSTACDADIVLSTALSISSPPCKLSLTPQPLQSHTRFHLSHCNDQIQNIVLFDVLGRKVSEVVFTTGLGDGILWRGTLQSGTYFYQITTENGTRKGGQLMVR